MGPKPTAGHSLDRIDVHGDYGPDCWWAKKGAAAADTPRKPIRRVPSRAKFAVIEFGTVRRTRFERRLACEAGTLWVHPCS